VIPAVPIIDDGHVWIQCDDFPNGSQGGRDRIDDDPLCCGHQVSHCSGILDPRSAQDFDPIIVIFKITGFRIDDEKAFQALCKKFMGDRQASAEVSVANTSVAFRQDQDWGVDIPHIKGGLINYNTFSINVFGMLFAM
jgi:hypothetical protein